VLWQAALPALSRASKERAYRAPLVESGFQMLWIEADCVT